MLSFRCFSHEGIGTGTSSPARRFLPSARLLLFRLFHRSSLSLLPPPIAGVNDDHENDDRDEGDEDDHQAGGDCQETGYALVNDGDERESRDAYHRLGLRQGDSEGSIFHPVVEVLQPPHDMVDLNLHPLYLGRDLEYLGDVPCSYGKKGVPTSSLREKKGCLKEELL